MTTVARVAVTAVALTVLTAAVLTAGLAFLARTDTDDA